MWEKPPDRIDTLGLSAAGIWVRRVVKSPSLTEEALSLAQVMETWELPELMSIESYRCEYVEVGGPELPPTWVYLVELIGRRTSRRLLVSSHPLSPIAVNGEVRLLALVRPEADQVLGVLCETPGSRRLLWLLEGGR